MNNIRNAKGYKSFLFEEMIREHRLQDPVYNQFNSKKSDYDFDMSSLYPVDVLTKKG